MRQTTHVNIHGVELDLSSLTEEEAQLYEQARHAYEDSPKWIDYKQKWMNDVLSIYDRQKLPRRESLAKPLFKAVQDFGSRLMVKAGKARMPGYREQIATLIETKFDTQREFCAATGLSEDMLSHVLKGRKDVSIGVLTESLGKIGYGLVIVPLSSAGVG